MHKHTNIYIQISTDGLTHHDDDGDDDDDYDDLNRVLTLDLDDDGDDEENDDRGDEVGSCS